MESGGSEQSRSGSPDRIGSSPTFTTRNVPTYHPTIAPLLAPLTRERVADFLAGGRWPSDLAPFDITRFG